VGRLGPLVQVWPQRVNGPGPAGRCSELLRKADDRHASLEHPHRAFAWARGRDDRARRALVRGNHHAGNEREAAAPPRQHLGAGSGSHRSSRARRPPGPDRTNLSPGRPWRYRRRRSRRPARDSRRELLGEPERLRGTRAPSCVPASFYTATWIRSQPLRSESGLIPAINEFRVVVNRRQGADGRCQMASTVAQLWCDVPVIVTAPVRFQSSSDVQLAPAAWLLSLPSRNAFDTCRTRDQELEPTLAPAPSAQTGSGGGIPGGRRRSRAL